MSLALATAPNTSLDAFALDEDFTHLGNFIVGCPDFTGCPRYEVHEIRAEHIGGPGDRSKSHWHGWQYALPERPIDDRDYKGVGEKTDEHPQGLARGHLNPAADNSQSQEATDDTHSTANCVPQDQAFNAQSWERSEQRGRDLALLAKRLKVKYRIVEINVPLFVPKQRGERVAAFVVVHGPDAVWEPTHLAKIYYVEFGSRMWTEAYLFENSAKVAHDDINAHVVAIDKIEALCNRDIFASVRSVKERMEASNAKPPRLEDLE